LVGAIYLDLGFEACRKVILNLMKDVIEDAITRGSGIDGKTALQELVAASGWPAPEYRVTESGPDHDKSFSAKVKVGDLVFAHGVGKSKKEAEQKAASLAFQDLKQK
ncbi:MAG: hypothetical protein RJA80_987, partial [Actinomycetota bacterium]